MQSLARTAGRVLAASLRQQSTRTVASLVSSMKSAKVQPGFQGLSAGFFWDDKHGFGYGKDGEVVLVTPAGRINIQTPLGIENNETRSFIEASRETFTESTWEATDTEDLDEPEEVTA